MPIYEYRCTACGESFSLLQKMGATATGTNCPKCGAAKIEKLISACSMDKSDDAFTSGPSCGIGND